MSLAPTPVSLSVRPYVGHTFRFPFCQRLWNLTKSWDDIALWWPTCWWTCWHPESQFVAHSICWDPASTTCRHASCKIIMMVMRRKRVRIMRLRTTMIMIDHGENKANSSFCHTFDVKCLPLDFVSCLQCKLHYHHHHNLHRKIITDYQSVNP